MGGNPAQITHNANLSCAFSFSYLLVFRKGYISKPTTCGREEIP